MADRTRVVGLIGVIGLAIYVSNLFVILGATEWKNYIQTLQDSVTFSRIARHEWFDLFKTSKLAHGANVSNISKKNDREFVQVKTGKVMYNRSKLTGNSTKHVLENTGLLSANARKRSPNVDKVLARKDNVKSLKGMESNKSRGQGQFDDRVDKLIQQQILRRKLRKLNIDPVAHIGFLKVHKAYSTILQTMFFRFGFQRNLTFVLPAKGHYFSKSTDSHEKLRAIQKGRRFDILCNHGYFNFSLYSSIVPRDSVYIAIVRDPLQQFISSFNYYKTRFKFKYLINLPHDQITNLILYPDHYEESWPLSYTMNSMAKDFGFNEFHYRDYKLGVNKSSAHEYLGSLGAIFEFVLVSEWLDESLVLLKRILNWSMKDILYVKRNQQTEEMFIDKELLTLFKDRNRLDYLLYDFFLDSFKKKLEKGGKSLKEETTHFTRTVFQVSEWCVEHYFGEYVVRTTKWNKKFVINSQDCNLMLKSEMDFINLLKKNQ